MRRDRYPGAHAGSLMWLAALAAIIVVVLALWLPFGLRRAAWADAWFYQGALLNGTTLVPLPNSRPLAFATWALSYALSPTSFLGLNLQILWFMLLKGVLVYAIVRLLAPKAIGLALAASLLSIVYPAEVGYFNDGYVSLHLGFDAYLLAVFLLLLSWRRRSRWLLAGAVIALAYTVFTYEVVLSLAIATPLLLVWQDGRVSRRVIRVSAVWFIPLALYFGYLVILNVGQQGLSTRETSLLAVGLSGPNPVAEVIGANLWNLRRQYFGGWADALTLSPFFRESTLAAIAAGLLMAVHMRVTPEAGSQRLTVRRWFELLLISVFWSALGYAVYSLASVRYDEWRIGFYTVIGSSLTAALLLYALSAAGGRTRWLLVALIVAAGGWAIYAHTQFWLVFLLLLAAAAFALPRRWRYPLLVSVALTVAMARQLDLHRWLTGEALNVQHIMTQVVQATEGVAADTPIVMVLDPQEWGSALPFNTSQHFDYALDLIYGDPARFGRLCPIGREGWGWSDETCTMTDEGIALDFAGETTLLTWDAPIVLIVHPDGTVALVEAIPEAWGGADSSTYAPQRLLHAGAPVPPGLDELFNPRPLVDR